MTPPVSHSSVSHSSFKQKPRASRLRKRERDPAPQQQQRFHHSATASAFSSASMFAQQQHYGLGLWRFELFLDPAIDQVVTPPAANAAANVNTNATTMDADNENPCASTSQDELSMESLEKLAVELEQLVEAIMETTDLMEIGERIRAFLHQMRVVFHFKRWRVVFRRILPDYPHFMRILVEFCMDWLMEFTGKVIQHAELQNQRVHQQCSRVSSTSSLSSSSSSSSSCSSASGSCSFDTTEFQAEIALIGDLLSISMDVVATFVWDLVKQWLQVASFPVDHLPPKRHRSMPQSGPCPDTEDSDAETNDTIWSSFSSNSVDGCSPAYHDLDHVDPTSYSSHWFWCCAHEWMPFLKSRRFVGFDGSHLVPSEANMMEKPLFDMGFLIRWLSACRRSTSSLLSLRRCGSGELASSLYAVELKLAVLLGVYLSYADPQRSWENSIDKIWDSLCEILALRQSHGQLNISTWQEFCMESQFRALIFRVIAYGNQKWYNWEHLLQHQVQLAMTTFRFIQEQSASLAVEVAEACSQWLPTEQTQEVLWMMSPFQVATPPPVGSSRLSSSSDSCECFQMEEMQCKDCLHDKQILGYDAVCPQEDCCLRMERPSSEAMENVCHLTHLCCAQMFEALFDVACAPVLKGNFVPLCRVSESLVECAVLVSLNVLRSVDPLSLSGPALSLHAISFIRYLLLESAMPDRLVEECLRKHDGWKVLLLNLPLFDSRVGLFSELVPHGVEFWSLDGNTFVGLGFTAKEQLGESVKYLSRSFILVQELALRLFCDATKKQLEAGDNGLLNLLLQLALRESTNDAFIHVTACVVKRLHESTKFLAKYFLSSPVSLSSLVRILNLQHRLGTSEREAAPVMLCRKNLLQLFDTLLNSSYAKKSIVDGLLSWTNLENRELLQRFSLLESFVKYLFNLLSQKPCVDMVLNMLMSVMTSAVRVLPARQESPANFASSQYSRLVEAELITVYLEKMSVMHSSENEDDNRTSTKMVDVLTHLLWKSAENLLVVQEVLRRCTAFIHLFSLLHSRRCADHIALCRKVIRICTLLMRRNREAKSEFRDILKQQNDDNDLAAYTPLFRVLNEAESVCTWPTLRVLLDMMTDGDSIGFEDDELIRIRNPDAVPVLFYLFPTCDEETQLRFLRCFGGLLGNETSGYHLLNRSICSYVQPSTFDQLMDCFFSSSWNVKNALVQVLSLIGSHSITVRQLKRIFRHIQLDPSCAGVFVGAMNDMIRKDNFSDLRGEIKLPARFFFLDGERTGLALQPIPKWPAPKGYSFCTWLALQSTNQEGGCIYCLSNRKGQGIKLSVIDGQLVYQVLGKTEPMETGIFLVERLWYNIGIVHSYSYFRTPAQVQLFVNGNLKWQKEAPYPEILGELSNCHIGAASKFADRKGSSVRDDAGPVAIGAMDLDPALVGMHLHALVGTVYFFRSALSSQTIWRVFELGPDCFLPIDVGTTSVDADGVNAILTSEVMLSYSPSVWEGKFVLDSTPEKNLLTQYGDSVKAVHALRFHGTHHIYTRSFVEVLDCIGGVQVLFPIFAHFDLIDFEKCSSTKRNLHDVEICANLLNLLASVFRMSLQSQLFMKEHRAPTTGVIRYLMGRVSSSHMNRSTLHTILQEISSPDETEMGRNLHQCFVAIWGDWRLWIQSPCQVQAELVDTLLSYASTDGIFSHDSSFRNLFTPQKIIDDLRLYYWVECAPSMLNQCEQGIFGESTHSKAAPPSRRISVYKGAREGRFDIRCSLNMDEKRHVRTGICRFLRKVLAFHGIGLVQLRAMVGFFVYCGDDVQRLDLMRAVTQEVFLKKARFLPELLRSVVKETESLMLDDVMAKLPNAALMKIVPSDVYFAVFFAPKLISLHFRLYALHVFCCLLGEICTSPSCEDARLPCQHVVGRTDRVMQILAQEGKKVTGGFYVYLNSNGIRSLKKDNSECQKIWSLLGIDPDRIVVILTCALRLIRGDPNQVAIYLINCILSTTSPEDDELLADASSLKHIVLKEGRNLFSNAVLIPCLLDQLTHCSLATRLMVLNQISALLHESRNALVFLAHATSWNVWLMRLMIAQEEEEEEAACAEDSLLDVVVRIVCQLLLFITMAKPHFENGHHLWWEWLCIIFETSKQVVPFQLGRRFQLNVMYEFLQTLHQRIRAEQADTQQSAREFCDGLRNVALLVEYEFVQRADSCMTFRHCTTSEMLSLWQIVYELNALFLMVLKPHRQDDVPSESIVSLPDNLRIMLARAMLMAFEDDLIHCFGKCSFCAMQRDVTHDFLESFQQIEAVFLCESDSDRVYSDNIFSLEETATLIRLVLNQKGIPEMWQQRICNLTKRVLLKSKAASCLARQVVDQVTDSPGDIDKFAELLLHLVRAELKQKFSSMQLKKKSQKHAKRVSTTAQGNEDWYLDTGWNASQLVQRSMIHLVHVELLEKAYLVKRFGIKRLQGIRNQLLQREQTRWKAMQERMDRFRQHSGRFWQRILRNMTNETAPWKYDPVSNNRADPSSLTKWKRCRTEDRFSRRRKVKQSCEMEVILPSSSQKQKDASVLLFPDKFPDAELNEKVQLSLANELLQARVLSAYGEEVYKKLMQYQEEELILENEEQLPPRALSFHESKPEVANNNQKLVELECELLVPMATSNCLFTLTSDFVSLESSNEQPSSQNPLHSARSHSQVSKLPRQFRKKHALKYLRRVFYRTHQFLPIALEFFFEGGKNFMLKFSSFENCQLVERTIRSLHVPRLESFNGRNPHRWLERSLLMEEWISGRISNFDYLMQLNSLAGRTHNDLAQYPVFPWIIADYTSEVLDLSNPCTFRDLKRPMGVQHDTALESFTERYRQLEEDYLASVQDGELESNSMLPPFHFGSHYSCAGFVIGFLLRLEPFTSYHRTLQGGRFDHADRLFSSIEAAYKSCTTNASDVRELIPEFFYLPEFLTNCNKCDFGLKQNSERVDNVALPKWAKSPEDFIWQHRKALESDYVSRNLHHWVDLIFGYKQRPPMFGGYPAAVESCNVYFHLTYRGAVDLDKLQQTDSQLYQTTLQQIDSFGQTPVQLFFRPHPPRNATSTFIFPMFSLSTIQTTTRGHNGFVSYPGWQISPWRYGLLYIYLDEARELLITVDTQRYVRVKRWKTLTPDSEPPFLLQLESETGESTTKAPSSVVMGSERIGIPFATNAVTTYAECDTLLSPLLFAHHPTKPWLFSCGHWDHSIRITELGEKGAISCLQSVVFQQDVVTCIKLSEDGRFLVSGSSDNTVAVWEIADGTSGMSGSGKEPMCAFPLHILSGHDDGITCVDVSSNFDLVLSCSADGTVNFYSLLRGKFIRCIRVIESRSRPLSKLTWVGVCMSSAILVYCETTSTLHLYSYNGKYIRSTLVNQKLSSFLFSQDGSCLIAGGKNSSICIFQTHDLALKMEIDGSNPSRAIRPFDASIQSMVTSNSEMHLLVGLSNGELRVLTPDAQYLRERFQDKLSRLGF